MNKKAIGVMKDELRGKIMIEFDAPKPKIYCYLTDDDNISKNLKEQKNTHYKEYLSLTIMKIAYLRMKSY